MTMTIDGQKERQLLFHAYHEAQNAKMIPFGEWHVPAYYSSIIEEHTWVRTKVGIFDISHMGEVSVTGADAYAFLQYLLSNDLDKYEEGTAFYSMMCNSHGGVVDDVFVYPVNRHEYFLVINAANCAKDSAWIAQHADGFDVCIHDHSTSRAMIAVQGPDSDGVVSKAFGIDSTEIAFHEFQTIDFQGVSVVVSATGYTGERGFEVLFDTAEGDAIWQSLIDAGAEYDMKPIGFGARDTLRLEAGCALYGHELSDTIFPFEARLSWVVSLNKKHDFIGKTALEALKAAGISRKLYGLVMIDRGIAREGYPVHVDGEVKGNITSGSFAPTTQKNIAMALLDDPQLTEGKEVAVEVRGRMCAAQIVKLPFYRRQR